MTPPENSTTAGAILQSHAHARKKYRPDDVRDAAIADFVAQAAPKFDAGQAEHDGRTDACNLVERANIQDAKEELIDLWFYLTALEIRARDLGVEL
tara:strand:+ start:456 stop:743 length:288 start_codon:yes stop_codon:yes gene_type:complete